MGETNGQMNHWKKERGTTLILRINVSSSYQKHTLSPLFVMSMARHGLGKLNWKVR